MIKKLLILYFLLFNANLLFSQKGFAIGDTLPDFSYPGQFTKSYSLKELRGSYVFVHCWASWNEESRKMQLEMIDHYVRFKDKRFKKGRRFHIISISLDEDQKIWELTLKKDNLPWKSQVCDFKSWDSPLVQKLKVNSIPSNFLLSPSGTILHMNVNPSELKSILNDL
jgi:peroxiredoxin